MLCAMRAMLTRPVGGGSASCKAGCGRIRLKRPARGGQSVQASDLEQQPERQQHATLEASISAACALEYQEASAYLAAAQQALELAEQPGTPRRLWLKALSEVGNAWRVRGSFAEAIQALDTVTVEAEKLPEPFRPQILALAHLRMAIVYDVVGSSLSGLEHLEAARVHYGELAGEAGLIRCQIVRAALYVRTGDHDHAVSRYLDCADYYPGAERRHALASGLSILTYVSRTM